MKIGLVQINSVIGAFDRNLESIGEWVEKAKKADCDLVVFPELTLCGYHPQDLLERPAFLAAHDAALEKLLSKITGIVCVIGVLEQRNGSGKPLYNSAFVIEEGRVIHRARKQLLPTFDVFDETRYFEAGTESTIFPLNGYHFGLSIGEDLWWDRRAYQVNPLKNFVIGAIVPDCLINISASPYYHGKLQERQDVFGQVCRKNNYPLLYVNQVGGQDGLIFDGHSLVVNTEGRVVAAGKGFVEGMVVVDIDDLPQHAAQVPVDNVATIEQALVLGVRDYLRKAGFSKAVIGLSGGIDSAVTAAIAVRALGPENVLCVAMPSPYTSQASIDTARDLAANLGCGFEILEIQEIMESYHKVLAPLLSKTAEDVTEQNIQARIRGNLLMAISNKFGGLLLSTGNKSEMAVGYCTLYGDMSGGLAVLADVPKAIVYELAQFYNDEQEVIPEYIITRPPSAELKPDQQDQDDLPPYEELDPILIAYLEKAQSVEDIAASGAARETVQDIVRRITLNEYKRKQAPLGIKVTPKAFGPGRRYPAVHGFKE